MLLLPLFSLVKREKHCTGSSNLTPERDSQSSSNRKVSNNAAPQNAQANENNSQEQGVLRRKASHSIHDLRHSCACETFYSFVAVFGDSADSRLQALEKVRKQLRHANMETTQNVYAALTERYSTWLSFSEGIDKDRLTLSAPHQSWGYSDG